MTVVQWLEHGAGGYRVRRVPRREVDESAAVLQLLPSDAQLGMLERAIAEGVVSVRALVEAVGEGAEYPWEYLTIALAEVDRDDGGAQR